MLSVGMALGASLAWGLADFLGGLRSRDGSPLPLLLVSQSLGLVLCGIALVLWAGPRPEASATGWAALSGCADLAGLWALYRGLACGAMGVVAPISAAGAVLPVAFGLLRGEHPPTLVLVAMTLALAGVVASSQVESSDRAVKPTLTSAVAFGLLAAFCFGLGFIAIGQASATDVTWAVFVNRLGSVLLVGAAYVVAGRPKLGGVVRHPGAAAIGVLDVTAIALFGLATTKGMLSVTSSLAAAYPLVTAALAWAILGERLRGGQRAGIAAAVVAAAVIGASASPESTVRPASTEAAGQRPPETQLGTTPVPPLVPVRELLRN